MTLFLDWLQHLVENDRDFKVGQAYKSLLLCTFLKGKAVDIEWCPTSDKVMAINRANSYVNPEYKNLVTYVVLQYFNGPAEIERWVTESGWQELENSGAIHKSGDPRIDNWVKTQYPVKYTQGVRDSIIAAKSAERSIPS